MPETSLPPHDREMPLSEHLRELRDRVVIVLAVTLALMAVAFPFSSSLVDIVLGHVVPASATLTVYEPLELLKVRIIVSFLAAVTIGFPLLVYEAFRFAAPGLYQHEKRFVYAVFPFSLLLFVAGSALAYFVTMPLFFDLLFNYEGSLASPELSIGQTFTIVTNFMLGFGVVFQVPLIILLAIRMGLVKRKALVDSRLVVYGLLVGFAVFISPDPTMLSQLIVGVVLILLFELSLLLARFI
ncbi:putative sec-independent translocase protein TatC [Methanocella paludicola SANAE]|uniref:Sec-independent protein translocase protein TatC n=1 Tax=Methanocella paludicola (strain DSM 17711 / JCM 13418 / NBRC 101707 / SANAE) TaxID=304371 RepID=D1Z2U5_METPS|nr:twin-arginine translocase subunit TatC [Methanocella paludicola]BAI63017.1 putative sec-independent translocase protein TatC [Methanocella paludicola SANAE]